MDDNNGMDENSEYSNIVSSSSNLLYGLSPTAHALDNDLGDHLGYPYTFGCQTRPPDSDAFGVQATSASNELHDSYSIIEKNCPECLDTAEPFCHVKLNTLLKLKDSTKKLLVLLEEIQSKTCSKNSNSNDSYQLSGLLAPSNQPVLSALPSLAEILSANAISKLEIQTKSLEEISIQDEADDCSVYKRLTRKCHCLNQHEYNDLVIHFNESTKYFTSSMGEIIKNMRILKRFLYIGNDYTKNALLFLNEGLNTSRHKEKVEIIQACAHADVCNVFDGQSIVTVCIAPPRNENGVDSTTQALAASFLNNLAQLEEGRRYLKFSSRITNELKKLIRKKASKLESDTLEYLNATMNLIHQPFTQNTNATYYCKPVFEAFSSKTVTALVQYRQYMTLKEVFTHLDLLNSMSNNNVDKNELTVLLPALLNLFKNMLIEYDNSEMNIVITKILSNVVSRSMVKESSSPLTVTMAETGTEPVKMLNQINQIPVKKNGNRNFTYRTLNRSTNKFREPQIRKKSVTWEAPFMNNLMKYPREPKYSVIIVPVEK